MHVVVLVRTQTAAEHDLRLLRGLGGILLVQRLVFRGVNRVVRLILAGGEAAVLLPNHRLVGVLGILAFGIEVLELDGAGVRHVGIREVHDRAAEMVALIVTDLLEVDGTPLEIAKLVIEVPVDRAGVDDWHLADERLLVQRLGFVEEIGVQGHVDTRIVNHALHPRRVTVLGQALPSVAEVAVVIVETHGQTLDDACRQFARIGLPLLGRVVLDERLVQRSADERDALVVEVGRVGAGEFARLLGDQRLGFGRRVVRVEELVDGAEVDRQREHLAIMRGVHAVDVVGELGETVHVFPDARVGGVEQVGAVLVDFGARFLVHV